MRSRGRVAAEGVRAGAVALAVVLVALVAGCGAPTGSPARTLGPLPYDLAQSPAPATATASPTPSGGPRLYFVRDGELVASPAAPSGSDLRSSVASVLDRLAAGPDEAQRGDGLSTALGPDVALELVDVRSGRAVVDVRAGDQPAGAGQLPLGVGQVVLTLTSVPGVEEVALRSDGRSVAAPLPDGALTDRPLVADDYRGLTAATS
ncbi:GerMN domain-containing protein [Phycicoccus avicenniae]|uniref:GerMN domain-containing protein n=1 Tax=Phycicoccus avicenniae TaxID=2828860 RepID=UPI003D267400